MFTPTTSAIRPPKTKNSTDPGPQQLGEHRAVAELPNHSLSVQMPVNSEKPITTAATTTTVSSSGLGRRDRSAAATGRPGPPLSGSSAKKSLMLRGVHGDLTHGWVVVAASGRGWREATLEGRARGPARSARGRPRRGPAAAGTEPVAAAQGAGHDPGLRSGLGSQDRIPATRLLRALASSTTAQPATSAGHRIVASSSSSVSVGGLLLDRGERRVVGLLDAEQRGELRLALQELGGVDEGEEPRRAGPSRTSAACRSISRTTCCSAESARSSGAPRAGRRSGSSPRRGRRRSRRRGARP